MLYNQHLEPISTSMSVRPQHLSTPPYTPHNSRSSIKILISTTPLPPPGRAQNRLVTGNPLSSMAMAKIIFFIKAF